MDKVKDEIYYLTEMHGVKQCQHKTLHPNLNSESTAASNERLCISIVVYIVGASSQIRNITLRICRDQATPLTVMAS